MTFTFCRRDKNLIKSHVIMTFANVRLGATPSEWAAIGDPNNAKQLTKFTNSAGFNCKNICESMGTICEGRFKTVLMQAKLETIAGVWWEAFQSILVVLLSATNVCLKNSKQYFK